MGKVSSLGEVYGHGGANGGARARSGCRERRSRSKQERERQRARLADLGAKCPSGHDGMV